MKRWAKAVFPSVLSILVALLVGFLGVVLTRGWDGALGAWGAMLSGAFGDWPRYFESGQLAAVARPLGEAALKASVLTLTGLSVAVAFRVGLFNIGAQGQLMVGALVAAVLGAKLSLPTVVHVPLCVLGAACGGAAWALLPAVLKLRRGVHEVISTIMLNWVAVSLIENWLVVGPLAAQASGDNSVSGTDQVLPTAELPRLWGEVSRLNVGLLVAVALALLVWWFFERFVEGFEWRVVGQNADAARAAGIDVGRAVLRAMLLAGALAGVAGAVVVLGSELKYPVTLGTRLDGIAMALIGQGHPLGVLAASALFGALRAGGTGMQLFGVHKSFPELVQGLALVLVAAKLVWERLADRLFPEVPHG